jgi:predicted ATPase
MELSYIWVSSFRNIENTGFNLSSRYSFEFNSRNQTLNILERNSFIPEFFGHNISNVTGIVGENAAGKTNLLELINYLMDGGNTKINSSFMMVFESSQQFQIFQYRLDQLNSNRRVDIMPYEANKIPMAPIYFTNTFDGRRHEFGKKVHDLSTNKLLQNTFGENIHHNIKKEVQAQIAFFKSHALRSMEQTNTLDSASLRPHMVQFTSPAWSTINNKARQFDEKASVILGRKFVHLTEFCSSFRKKITDNFSGMSFSYFATFLVYLDFVCNEFAPETNLRRQAYRSEPKDTERFIDELPNLQLEFLVDARINEIFDVITKEVAQFIDDRYPHTFEKFRFLSDLNKRNLPQIEKLTEGTYTSRKFQFRSPFTREIESFIQAYSEATTQQNLNFTIEWLGISSGQRAFLNLFSRLYSVSGIIKQSALLITIDEGDLYFHPKWQVEYLARLLWTLPIIFEGKTIQLVLTTHSPFLVSDLTKNHLIFLRRGINQNCELLPTDMLQDTFGGNIGELYLNAFFLQGNLISHFAAEKIKYLLEKVKGDRTNFNGYDLRLIDQLGDRLIKFQLATYLNDTNQ